MIHHIVLVKFRADVTASERDGIWADLAALKHALPGLLSSKFGPNISPEGLARGYSHAFVMTFEDAAARDAYLVHPDHKKAGARLVAAAKGGVDGICVVDI